MTALLGMMTGGFVAVLVLAVIWEKAAFQNLVDDPVTGKLLSVVAGWFTASIIAGFGMADGGPFEMQTFLIYGVPALILAALAHRRGVKLREEIEAEG